MRAMNGLKKKPLMVYCHVPFCASKCHFCDWVQAIPKTDLLLKASSSRRQSYIAALEREIRGRGPLLSNTGYAPTVLYFGGGTASALATDEMQVVMTSLRESLILSDVIEATIECSPDSLTAQKLSDYRALGFNRISFGVQSLVDARLRSIGRAHTSKDVIDSVRMCRRSGFENINLDIMCGFPDETEQELKRTMEIAKQLVVPHISIYPYRPTLGTHLRNQVMQLDRRLHLRRVLDAYSLLRRECLVMGLREYAVGYFGAIAETIIRPFGLDLETVGFGSGAISILQCEHRAHVAGGLTQYIEDPMKWDFQMPASNPAVCASILRSGLSLSSGIDSHKWLAHVGLSLNDSIRQTPLKPILEFLRKVGHLKENEQGISLPVERAAYTLTTLAIDSAMLCE